MKPVPQVIRNNEYNKKNYQDNTEDTRTYIGTELVGKYWFLIQKKTRRMSNEIGCPSKCFIIQLMHSIIMNCRIVKDTLKI